MDMELAALQLYKISVAPTRYKLLLDKNDHKENEKALNSSWIIYWCIKHAMLSTLDFRITIDIWYPFVLWDIDV